MGSNIRRCGPAGAGTAVKLVNQLLVGIHTAAAAEAVVLGVKAGADPQIMLDVISTSYGASRMLQRNLPLQIARDWTPTTPVSVILKDLLLIHEFARDQGARLLLGGLSLELYKEAVQLGYGDQDMSAMCLPLERIAGSEIRPKADRRAAQSPRFLAIPGRELLSRRSGAAYTVFDRSIACVLSRARSAQPSPPCAHLTGSIVDRRRLLPGAGPR